jgi:hypothetical protein
MLHAKNMQMTKLLRFEPHSKPMLLRGSGAIQITISVSRTQTLLQCGWEYPGRRLSMRRENSDTHASATELF